MISHEFLPTILREYDVRGVIGETLFADDARALGRAFGTRVIRNGGTRVSVGRDGRLSSPDMEAAVIEGLTAAGITVARLGSVATPMLYYSVYALKTDGGIMITGSHNPPNHNGFKMMLGKGPFFGTDIQDLGRIAAEGDFESGKGAVEDAVIIGGYVDRLLRDVNLGRQLKIVWDCGNGAAGPSVDQVCTRLPSSHTVLFPEIDGTFPNHHPDPTVPENLEDLVAMVLERGADLGIAFDGDGDRIGVIDDKGRVLWGDQLLTVLAEDVLKENPGATVIADVKASQVLFDKIAEFGGKPLMWRTGHSLIKTKMAETGAPLAGEMSGHIFFKDRYYGFDDALYAAIRLIEGLSHRDEPLSAIRDALPQVLNTPEMRFQCDDTLKFDIVTRVKDWLAGQTGIKVSDADGVRVNTPDGWWLLRASNTQDVLVARCESRTEEGLDRLKGKLRDALTSVGWTAPDI